MGAGIRKISSVQKTHPFYLTFYCSRLLSYRRAFKDLRGQISEMEFYVYETWSIEQILPWEHLQIALPKSTLIKHLATAEAEFGLLAAS